MIVDTIPVDFIDRQLAEDWRRRPVMDSQYPEGINHTTRVSVVIRHDGKNILIEDKPAQCFGWEPRPAVPSCAGLEPSDAPITYYKILSESN